MTKKKTLPFKDPKQCPCGHKHLSWGPGEKQVYCWDCDKNYPLSECFGSRTVSPPSKAFEKQRDLFEPDDEPRKDSDQALEEEKPDE